MFRGARRAGMPPAPRPDCAIRRPRDIQGGASVGRAIFGDFGSAGVDSAAIRSVPNIAEGGSLGRHDRRIGALLPVTRSDRADEDLLPLSRSPARFRVGGGSCSARGLRPLAQRGLLDSAFRASPLLIDHPLCHSEGGRRPTEESGWGHWRGGSIRLPDSSLAALAQNDMTASRDARRCRNVTLSPARAHGHIPAGLPRPARRHNEKAGPKARSWLLEASSRYLITK